MTTTEKQARRYVALWVERLSLKDWKVDVRVLTSEEIGAATGWEDVPLNAAIGWFVEQNEATIYIDKAFEDPLERLIVHELLHLRFQGHKDHECWEYDPHLEKAINMTADALLAAYGRKRKRTDGKNS